MPTLEEISDDDIDDIDNMDYDPSDFDPKNPFAKSNPVNVRSPFGEPSQPASSAVAAPASESPSGSAAGSGTASPSGPDPSRRPANYPTAGGIPVINNTEDMDQFKTWQVIYPVYFDASKTHAEGRRVSKDLAVENPLAQTIMDALRTIGVRTVFEITKVHPKDWANPGRIRVQLRDGTSRVPIKNKRHLYILIGQYLKSHPTTDKTPLESPVYASLAQQQGIQLPEKSEPLAIPTGWKINTILPLTSRALSGGEATDEMMSQMQNQMFPGLNMPDVKPPKKKIIRAR
ncbi:Sec65p [Sugiyamaella lignohabitans]|uniref:Sec65p n=1 Tax=Sugiyamaella lignohabitans TaxID=796027 RepID=A0A161HJF6_9ASCO|nr:Sec65p [Sugiyamaella lignohabitans]ANB11548.1 Sec65p [Sugiyamaella lignohabitans]